VGRLVARHLPSLIVKRNLIMKITANRIKEIIREEYRRMNEATGANLVIKRISLKDFEDEIDKETGKFKNPAFDEVIRQLIEKEDGRDVEQITSMRQKGDMYILDTDQGKVSVGFGVGPNDPPPFTGRVVKPSPEDDALDRKRRDKPMLEVAPESRSIGTPPAGDAGMESLKAAGIKAIKGITSVQGREDEIIQLFTNIINIISDKKVDTPAVMAHFTRAKGAIEKTAN